MTVNHCQKVHHLLNVVLWRCQCHVHNRLHQRQRQKSANHVVKVARHRIDHVGVGVKRNVHRRQQQSEVAAHLVRARRVEVVEAGVAAIHRMRGVTLKFVKRRTVFNQRGIIVLVIVPTVNQIVIRGQFDEIIDADRHHTRDDVVVQEDVVVQGPHELEEDLGKLTLTF